MTPDIERWEFGDPLNVLERRQAQRCVGCQHAVPREDPFGGVRMVCRKGRKYGKRCAQYKEATK